MSLREVPKIRLQTALLLLGLALFALLAAAPAKGAAPLALPSLAALDRESMAVAEAISPCVVLVQVEQSRTSPSGRSRHARAQGSGVIIDSSGLVLTNQHMIEDATSATIYLPGGEKLNGEVVAADTVRDLAVLRVHATHPLPSATLGDSEQERPGAWVMAAGYPFGGELDITHAYEPSMTVGIVSAIGREVESETRGQSYRGLLQTDAAINPGNSGGPLVNSRGEVIGINQAIYTPELVGANVGIGFAIPINARTRQIIRTLMSGGTVVRGFLGASLTELTDAIKEKQNVQTGTLVTQVEARGPAAAAGLKQGDVLVSIGSTPINSPGQAVDIVQETRPDTPVSIGIVRDGHPMTIQVVVGKMT